ncbi:MAG TPA: ribonuclease P protein component [Acidobacteriota bacterium]|nr:ribonuclease P protein component [Acidobacteriota bacterium]
MDNAKSSEEFPKRVRIIRSSDYRIIYKTGLKVYSERFILFGRFNHAGYPRLGLTVSRKVGGAVVRNRVKRLFREIFRRSIDQIPCRLDIVVNAKYEVAGAKYEELRAEFIEAARKLAR